MKVAHTLIPPANSQSTPIGRRVQHMLWRPSVLVALLYLVFLGLMTLIYHYDLTHYIHIGERFTRHQFLLPPGYDGQFYYQLARDPFHAYQFMDHPPYRYQRIFYSLLAGLLSLGQASLLPFMLLFLNFVSIVFSVEVVSRLLRKYGLSPWFSLALGLYFGQAAAFIFDTTEPLTYALVCLGLWLIERQRISWAGLCMGLAILCRETAILFPLGYILFYLQQRSWRNAALFGLLSLLPVIIWYSCIWRIFGESGLGYAPPFEHIPFAGIFYFVHDSFRFAQIVLFMLIPTLLIWFFALRDSLRLRWNYLLLILLLHLIMVTLMAPASYSELVSCGRLSTGLVLACLLYGWQTRNKAFLWASQVYSLTFPLYCFGVLIQMISH